jgi:hypothetical protein
MSLIGSAGAGGAQGHSSPLIPPTSATISRVDLISNGSTPNFSVSYTSQTQTGRKQNIFEGYTIYKTSDNTSVKRVAAGTTTNYATIVAGTSYYAKPLIYDSVTNREVTGTATSEIIAMTKPADVGAVSTLSLIGGVQFNWTATDNGGDSAGHYYQISVYISGTFSFSTSTTVNNYTYNTTSTGTTYSVRVRAWNAYGSATNESTSAGVSPSAAPPPPPPPPPPYFAPPFFGPYFPPYFGGPFFGCIEAETPIMVWVDGNKLYKKAKDITVGDKLVSYSFNELPESEFDYSLDTWSEESLTPKNVESADVVSVQELITKATMYLNNNIDTRMSLDHSVFVKRNETYSIIASGLIEVGDIVIQLDPDTMELSEIVVNNIDYIDEESKIYKIDCKPYDVFFAGHILTHNRKKFY